MYAISGTVFASIIILAGPLSGGHFNPAVTLAILVRESVETGSNFASNAKMAILIIFTQILGGGFGILISWLA
jgi:glycerol uptake facilitator-like aquaporin